MAVLAITRPVAGAAILASDIDAIADQLETWSTQIDGLNIVAIPTHAASHGIAGTDSLNDSFVGIGTGIITSGLTVQTAFRMTFPGGGNNPTIDWSKSGAPVVARDAAPPTAWDINFTNYAVVSRYLVFATFMRLAIGQAVLMVSAQVATGIRVILTDAAGALYAPIANDQFHIIVIEVRP